MTISSTINYAGGDQHAFERVLSKLSGNNTAKTSGITKSLRLDQDIFSKVEQQASKNGTSFNAEINNMLRKYVEWDMLASTVGMIPIARPVLSEIFQKLLTREQVIDLANSIARLASLDMVLFMKGNLTLESFLSWLKTRMEHGSQVNYAVEDNGHQMRMIFKHDLGENWSIYHKIITEHILYEILRENATIGVEISPTTLVLCFRRINGPTG